MMKKQVSDFKVQGVISHPSSFFTLLLKHPSTLPPIEPGQFVEIAVGKDVLLRRPISIHDVDATKNEIKLLVQSVGKGTAWLSQLKTGDVVNLIFPLGKSFSLKGEQVLLIGGGCGIAPLLYLARKFNEKGIRPLILLGGRTKNHIPNLDLFTSFGNIFVATEDGSMGIKGRVTDHEILYSKVDRIYTCGPNPMMKAIGKYALENKIPCEMSLENTMACGIGACLCCVVDSDEGNVCVCKEGPVFEASRLTKWIGC